MRQNLHVEYTQAANVDERRTARKRKNASTTNILVYKPDIVRTYFSLAPRNHYNPIIPSFSNIPVLIVRIILGPRSSLYPIMSLRTRIVSSFHQMHRVFSAYTFHFYSTERDKFHVSHSSHRKKERYEPS